MHAAVSNGALRAQCNAANYVCTEHLPFKLTERDCVQSMGCVVHARKCCTMHGSCTVVLLVYGISAWIRTCKLAWNTCRPTCITSNNDNVMACVYPKHFHRYLSRIFVPKYRFSHPFLSHLQSISSIFNSISSGEAYRVQILSSISSNCHSYLFVNQI